MMKVLEVMRCIAKFEGSQAIPSFEDFVCSLNELLGKFYFPTVSTDLLVFATSSMSNVVVS